MTDNTPVASPLAESGRASSAKNTISLVALILAIAGFVLGVIPATAGLAWLLLLPAAILSIVSLAKKGTKKGRATAALITATIGWIVAVIVALVAIVGGANQAINTPDAPSVSDEGSAPEEPVIEEAAIGDTVTNDDGVSFTVSAITCGIPVAGPEFLSETASGQFCEIKFTLFNGSNDAVYISSSDVTGTIGEATYDANTSVSQFGDNYFGTDVNPGLGIDCVVYIDIPADGALDSISYHPIFGFLTDGVTVRAS